MNKRQHFLVSLMAVTSLSILPTVALAQILPGWDFYVSAFEGGALPFNTDIEVGGLRLGPFEMPGSTVRDVELKNSISFGGKIGAWTTAIRAKTSLDLGVEVDVTQLQSRYKAPARSVRN